MSRGIIRLTMLHRTSPIQKRSISINPTQYRCVRFSLAVCSYTERTRVGFNTTARWKFAQTRLRSLVGIGQLVDFKSLGIEWCMYYLTVAEKAIGNYTATINTAHAREKPWMVRIAGHTTDGRVVCAFTQPVRPCSVKSHFYAYLSTPRHNIFIVFFYLAIQDRCVVYRRIIIGVCIIQDFIPKLPWRGEYSDFPARP